MLSMMFLPQKMMLASMEAAQTFFVKYVEASQHIVAEGQNASEEAAETASEAAEDVNWAAQEALRAAGETQSDSLPV